MKFKDFNKKYEYVFVYGTLKEGNFNDLVMQNATKIGNDITFKDDYEMVDLGHFPGVIQGTYRIGGQVWKVDEETFNDLDDLEGHPNFYVRNKVLMSNFNGECWMYVLTSETQKMYNTDEIRYHEDNMDNVTTNNGIQVWSVPYITELKGVL